MKLISHYRTLNFFGCLGLRIIHSQQEEATLSKPTQSKSAIQQDQVTFIIIFNLFKLN